MIIYIIGAVLLKIYIQVFLKPTQSLNTSKPATTAPSRTVTSSNQGAGDSQYKKQVEELNDKLIAMEQSLESLERVSLKI